MAANAGHLVLIQVLAAQINIDLTRQTAVAE